MVLVAAIALGAAIGAVAGTLVYSAKVALSEEQTWHWKDALAAAGGGLVGGGLFPPLLIGLAAIKLPAAAAYVVAGGVAWGGIWALAEDAARWGLGRADGLGSLGRYALATGIGVAVSALIFPAAARVLDRGALVPHSGRPEAFVAPANPVSANTVKAEGEFLAYGAGAEAGDKAVTAGTRAIVDQAPDPPRDMTQNRRRAHRHNAHSRRGARSSRGAHSRRGADKRRGAQKRRGTRKKRGAHTGRGAHQRQGPRTSRKRRRGLAGALSR